MTRQLVHIEPDPALAEEVRRAFSPAGFSVVNLTTGESVVDRCKTSRPDLILLSAELPDMSGFSVCNRLKRALGTVPLILYSGEATPSAIEAHRATRTHADEYLTKPFEIADLLGHAAHLLEGSAEQPAPSSTFVPPAFPSSDVSIEVPLEGEIPPPVPRPLTAPSPVPSLDEAAVPVEWLTAEAAPPLQIVDPFIDAPRDPAPPRGSPEEKLEFFRERLRARDVFLGRVREAFGMARSEAERLVRVGDALRANLTQAVAQHTAFEERIRELEATVSERDARFADFEKKLGEAESTRQSLSDVLSETMQQREAAEQQWSSRLAAAEEDHARVEAQHQEDQRKAEEELTRRSGEWDSERSELNTRIHQIESERDEVAATVKQFEAQIEYEAGNYREWKEAAERDLADVRGNLDAARAHSEAQATELAETRSRIEILEAEIERRKEEIAAHHGEFKAAKAEATAYAEKAVATEQAYLAQGTELETVRRRNAELAAALDEGRASVEGVRGEVTRLQEELARQTRQLTQVTAERKQLDQEIAAERKAREEAQITAEKQLAEVNRLRDLETQAADGPRLRRELALAQEVLRQRTQQLESAARSVHDAGAERERIREKLELEVTRLSNELARRDSEAAAIRRRIPELEQKGAEREEQLRRAVENLRRRISELEQKGTEREEQLRRAVSEVENQRQARAAEAVEIEKRHLSDAQRLKATLVDLERRLEASARSEIQLHKRITELEKTGAAPASSSQESEGIQAKAKALEEEIQELRSENDFLNSEVARFHQKNKELLTRIQAMGES